jgi:DNA invertase Pin-like site-specific DNA recombinase
MAKTEGKRVSKRVAIYLRVSTTEQTTTNQRRELHAARLSSDFSRDAPQTYRRVGSYAVSPVASALIWSFE